MSSTAIHIDGLWLCLRPAFSQAIATRSAQVLPRRKWTKTTARPLSTTSPRPAFAELHSISNASSVPSTPSNGANNGTWNRQERSANQHAAPHRRRQMAERIEQDPYHWTAPKHLKRQGTIVRYLEKYPDSTVERFLEDAVKNKLSYISVVRLVKELVETRGVKPTTRHYTQLLYANSDPRNGNPYQVRRLLEEMEENDILADSATFHAALRALAVHPDYVLRHEILQTLRERWISLSPAGWHDVVVGYTRERQYEMALNTLSHMESQQVPVQDWLYGLLIYNLCDAEEFGEALRLMKARLASGHNLSPNLWMRVLDLASEALEEEMVSFIWHRRVETGYIHPSFGVCNNVLTITSRTGNVKLAMSVFKILEERKATFTQNDYEALIDTYVAAGDVESALRVLSSLKNISTSVDMAPTRSILTGLLRSKQQPLDIWHGLKNLHEEENLDIPVVAVNTLLEHCALSGDQDTAVQIYKEMHLISSGKPTTNTFNVLLHMARVSKTMDTARFFLDEMRRSGLFPNEVTYQNLILLSAEEGNFTETKTYFFEMIQSGFNLTSRGRYALEKICRDSDRGEARRFWRVVETRQAMTRDEIGRLAREKYDAERVSVGVVDAGRSTGGGQLTEYEENVRIAKVSMENAAKWAQSRETSKTRTLSVRKNRGTMKRWEERQRK